MTLKKNARRAPSMQSTRTQDVKALRRRLAREINQRWVPEHLLSVDPTAYDCRELRRLIGQASQYRRR